MTLENKQTVAEVREITPRDGWALSVLARRPSMPEKEQTEWIGKLSDTARGIARALLNPEHDASPEDRSAADALVRWNENLKADFEKYGRPVLQIRRERIDAYKNRQKAG